jgi:hypothetical protein
MQLSALAQRARCFVSSVAMLLFLAGTLFVVAGCGQLQQQVNNSEEMTMEQRTKMVLDAMEMSEGYAQTIVKRLDALGVTTFSSVVADKDAYGAVMYVKDSDGDTYCLSLGVRGSVGGIYKDNLQGEQLYYVR